MTLVVEQLSGRGQGGELVHRVSLEVGAGECLALVGGSESGAHLLLRLLAGTARVSQGRIWLSGQELGGIPAARRPLRLVDLDAPLPPRRTFAELGGATLGEGVIELLGLGGMEAKPLGRLEPALRPRAALALALATGSRALLLAELGRAQTPVARDALYELVGAVRRALGLPVLVATADPETAFALAGRVVIMHGGRLLEAGSAQEIYLRPQTDVGAAALGPVNLLVGNCTDDGVQVGPFVFLTRVAGGPSERRPRVQLMFRPEDVELAAEAAELGGTPLGRAEVLTRRYAGPLERLRLRLPTIPGVRPVAPQPPFGEPGLLLDAARSAEQARRAPLAPGDQAWAAVRRFHALPHPGLHFAVVGPEAPGARRLAELVAGRLSVLERGDEHAELTLERLHASRQHDVAVLSSLDPGALGLLDRLLEHGRQHVLLLGELHDPPARGLICIAGEEGDKATVQFAARLLRHLGATATLLTVLPVSNPAPPERLARFHVAACETMAALGVSARSVFRNGEPLAEILAQHAEGTYDLLVIAAPGLRRGGPHLVHLLARKLAPSPLLVVRAAGLAPSAEPVGAGPVARMRPDLSLPW